MKPSATHQTTFNIMLALIGITPFVLIGMGIHSHYTAPPPPVPTAQSIVPPISPAMQEKMLETQREWHRRWEQQQEEILFPTPTPDDTADESREVLPTP